jgi:hypothetical protein
MLVVQTKDQMPGWAWDARGSLPSPAAPPQLLPGGEGQGQAAHRRGQVPDHQKGHEAAAQHRREAGAGQPHQGTDRVPGRQHVEAVEEPQQARRHRHDHEGGGSGVERRHARKIGWNIEQSAQP